ncbi:MAG: fructosamine kinase family protein [bacterium]|nr:fructosamine kinase family protein [bacterium]
MESILTQLLKKKVEVLSKTPLSGGDINAVFKIQTDQGMFCVKQNDRKRFPEMLQKEANGLVELAEKSSFHVPKAIGAAEDENSQYLVLDFIEPGAKSNTFWEDFGKALAAMHRQTTNHFGWKEDNYIGSLPQYNRKHDNWSDFYAIERILPQIQRAFDSNKVDDKFVKAAERLCTKLDELFPKEVPALLHGDLWSGNFMVNADGSPVLIDPAVYYGHREMDLGMMHLFGGFSDSLFDVYHEEFPLETNWRDRIPLTQLYPLLVHVNLFGGGYVQSAATVIQRYL